LDVAAATTLGNRSTQPVNVLLAAPQQSLKGCEQIGSSNA